MLSILCNLLQVPVNVAYFMNTACDKIVQYFVNSTDPKTRILSVSILCYLEPRSILNQDLLELRSEDVKFMVDLVLASISEGSSFLRPVSLLRALHAIVKISETNGQKFISQGLMSVTTSLVAECDSDIQKEVTLILWTLASYSTLKPEINLHRVVDNLKGSHLATLCTCALNEQSKERGMWPLMLSYLSPEVNI